MDTSLDKSDSPFREDPQPGEGNDPEKTGPDPPEDKPYVVGIGASAGGIGALQEFLSYLDVGAGIVYVIVLHLAADRASYLSEVLAPHSSLPIQQVSGTIDMKPDHVYVIPPDFHLNTIDGHLRLSQLDGQRPRPTTIDHFLKTLAFTHGPAAIGVILTGTGSDGTLGLREIKTRNGFTLAQDPEEAEFSAMPESAIAAGVVDVVASVSEIPGHIFKFTQTTPRLDHPVDNDDVEGDDRSVIQEILDLVHQQTGRSFKLYKPSTISRRIARRMQVCEIEEIDDYLEYLRSAQLEAQRLSDDFLITVTSFFRDPDVFNAVADSVLPRLVDGKSSSDSLRIWSIGCATGEEAYSLAMLLLEASDDWEHVPRIQIFATDLHEESLETARAGIYPTAIEGDVSQQRLNRFFTKVADGYKIRSAVRELILFASHNLLSDPPFPRLDMISCRNVMIYLQGSLQSRVFQLFHYALSPSGVLLLGTSETRDRSGLFADLDREHHILVRQGEVSHTPSFPIVLPSSESPEESSPEHLFHSYRSGSELHEQMLELYAPPSLLVDPEDFIIHYSESVGQFLQHPGGSPTNSVVKLIRPELKIELTSLLQLVRRSGRPARSRPVNLPVAGGTEIVVIRAHPAERSSMRGSTLLLFDSVEFDGAAHEIGEFDDSSSADEIRAENAVLRQRLRTSIDEYETSKEEMKASNEELQASNEELRSTLEELETSTEELESANEELRTLNQEDRQRVSELSRLTSDLQNLFAATDIATVFLDKKLTVRRYTPKAKQLFNLKNKDKGRPLSDITNHLGYDNLIEDAEAVLERLAPVEREIQDSSQRWYLTRILPYRSSDDLIDGIVITLVDVTERKRAEEQVVRQARALRLALDAADMGFWRWDPVAGLIDADPRARHILGLNGDESMSMTEWGELFVHPDDRADFDGAISAVRKTEGHPRFETEFRRLRSDSRTQWVFLAGQAELADGESTSVECIVGTVTDITDVKDVEKSLEARVTERTTEVLKSKEQLREAMRALTIAEQAERRRVSHILHDDLQQLLYGIEMRLEAHQSGLLAEKKLEAAAEIGETREWLQQGINTTRELTVDLSPPVLRSEGLAEALEWLQRQMSEVHHLDVTLDIENGVNIQDSGLRILLFQTLRELLFNVRKHAGVDAARLAMRTSESNELILAVSDDGKGFDPEAAKSIEPERGGFGLSAAKERIALAGGTFSVTSAVGEGSAVEISIPLDFLSDSNGGVSV